MSEYHSQWIAENYGVGWGRGATPDDALANFATANLHKIQKYETLTVTMTEARGYRGGAAGEVDADEIVSEQTVDFSTDHLQAIGEKKQALNRDVETVLVQSDFEE